MSRHTRRIGKPRQVEPPANTIAMFNQCYRARALFAGNHVCLLSTNICGKRPELLLKERGNRLRRKRGHTYVIGHMAQHCGISLNIVSKHCGYKPPSFGKKCHRVRETARPTEFDLTFQARIPTHTNEAIGLHSPI